MEGERGLTEEMEEEDRWKGATFGVFISPLVALGPGTGNGPEEQQRRLGIDISTLKVVCILDKEIDPLLLTSQRYRAGLSSSSSRLAEIGDKWTPPRVSSFHLDDITTSEPIIDQSTLVVSGTSRLSRLIPRCPSNNLPYRLFPMYVPNLHPMWWPSLTVAIQDRKMSALHAEDIPLPPSHTSPVQNEAILADVDVSQISNTDGQQSRAKGPGATAEIDQRAGDEEKLGSRETGLGPETEERGAISSTPPELQPPDTTVHEHHIIEGEFDVLDSGGGETSVAASSSQPASTLPNVVIRSQSPSSRTSTPPLVAGTSAPAAKKFSSVNVNKKFLSKTASPAAGSPSISAKLNSLSCEFSICSLSPNLSERSFLPYTDIQRLLPSALYQAHHHSFIQVEYIS